MVAEAAADVSVALGPAESVTDEFAATMTHLLASARTDGAPIHLFSAVSGGPDSMALACMADRFAHNSGAHDISVRHTVLIVDHGIRADSADEARRVAARLRRRGMNVEILRVTARSPRAGLQAWARRHRYALMLARVRQSRGCLLLGHHAGDQAETVMMRLRRGSGLAGLAAMQPDSWRQGVLILRPLLGIAPEALADHCRACGIAFERDPTNADHRYERVRVRAALAAAPDVMSDRLVSLARMAGSIDRALLSALAEDGYLPTFRPSGHCTLPVTVTRLPTVAATRLLGFVIARIAAPSPPPSMLALSRLRARLEEGRPATLGGARFSRHDSGWLVTAEIGRSPPRRPVVAGERALFAGVWEITSGVDATVRHLGEAGSGVGRPWRDTPGWCALPSLVRRALPVLETLDGALIYPHLQGSEMCNGAVAEATATFLSQSPALGAPVLETAIGKTHRY